MEKDIEKYFDESDKDKSYNIEFSYPNSEVEFYNGDEDFTIPLTTLDYELPDYEPPDYELPDYEPPDYELPDYEPPDYEPPDYEPSDLGELDLQNWSIDISVLLGTEDNDYLVGDESPNSLSGLEGSDTLTGAEGNDKYIFYLSNRLNHDVIRDNSKDRDDKLYIHNNFSYLDSPTPNFFLEDITVSLDSHSSKGIKLSIDDNNQIFLSKQLAGDYSGIESIHLDDGTVVNNNVFAEMTAALNPTLSSDEQNALLTNILHNNEQAKTIELFRFRNTTFDTGTYIFVDANEKEAILDNPDFNQTFELEGNGDPAFVASRENGDDLIPFYRLKSRDISGTYLFVSTEEYNTIFDEDSAQKDKWIQEGLDRDGNDIAEFYLYDRAVNLGTEFNRFQNTQNNTFLYAGSSETAAIEDDPNLSNLFLHQGGAFKSSI